MAHIFMAEDDPLMSRMYERAFRIAGHDVTLAADGEEAFTVLTHMDPKPDALIFDVMMPKMSGFDVLRAIRTNGALTRVPAVMLTNLAGEQDVAKGEDLGATAYLIKSQYDPKQIVAKVEEIIAAHKAKS